MSIEINRVDIESSPYDCFLGKGLLDEIGSLLIDILPSKRVCVITDPEVDKYYSKKVLNSLSLAGFKPEKYIIPGGEQCKNLLTYEEILNFLAKLQFSRKDAILALGGGVVGDISGFVSATFKRGVPFIQIPTSLLAIIDSSIGGKTGVNLSFGKNLVGAFYQPKLVVADINTLSTLRDTEIKNGYGELIKYALLDAKLWKTIKSEKNLVSSNILSACILQKIEIVKKDCHESGLRMLLNLGHTLGHAIEKLSSFSVPHGSAVATGIAIMARICNNQHILKNEEFDDILSTLEFHGFESHSKFSTEALISLAFGDKKAENDSISFIAIHGIGDCRITKMSKPDFLEFCLCM
ncbi:MAG: 3-dehydroquinate synthase [Christensenellaceae bacterium]|jgi:3-dehydroquinate synthase|nr:3-dehydroquinate synthase [Christensenellaceae bacterium]